MRYGLTANCKRFLIIPLCGSIRAATSRDRVDCLADFHAGVAGFEVVGSKQGVEELGAVHELRLFRCQILQPLLDVPQIFDKLRIAGGVFGNLLEQQVAFHPHRSGLEHLLLFGI